MKKNQGMGIIVCLSVDDGSEDSYAHIFPLLQKYEMPMTFNVITDCIAGKRKMPDAGLNAMTREQLQEMSGSHLTEIACHSADHTNRMESALRGRSDLLEWLGLPANTGMGFASPDSKMSMMEILEHRKEYEGAGFAYIRTGARLESWEVLRRTARRLSRIIHMGWLYAFAYHDTLLDEKNEFVLCAVPVMHENTEHQINALIRHAEKVGKNIILMLHRVKSSGESMYKDPWTWDIGKLEGLLQFLADEQKSGRLQVKCVKELAEG